MECDSSSANRPDIGVKSETDNKLQDNVIIVDSDDESDEPGPEVNIELNEQSKSN